MKKKNLIEIIVEVVFIVSENIIRVQIHNYKQRKSGERDANSLHCKNCSSLLFTRLRPFGLWHFK